MELRRSTKSYEGYPWHEQHKEELKDYAREYRAANPDYNKRRAEKAKQDRLNDPAFFRAREFAREMKAYGTTIGWYRDKLIEQNGTCALCHHLSYVQGKMQRLQVDHNHACCDVKTKSCGECLRGLLCADCNIQLSYVERTLTMGSIVPTPGSWLARAMEYLDSYAVQFNFGYNAFSAVA